MQPRYEENFASLNAAEATYLANAISRRNSEIVPEQGGEYESGRDLFHQLDTYGLDHADAVMSLARDATASGVVIVEKLVGHPIVRPSPKSPAAPRGRRGPRRTVARHDPRVISHVVAENPKRAGTAAHERFKLYRTGMTVSDFLRAGGTMADVNWDLERGFIRLGEE